MEVRFVSLALLLLLMNTIEKTDCSYSDDTADKQNGGDNKTELKDSLFNIVLVTIFLLLGVDHGVVVPDTVGPDEGDQHHLGRTILLSITN